MKKSVAVVLLLCSVCLILSSCGNIGYEKGKTFSTEFLKSVSLENMPLPDIGEYALNSRTEGQETLRIETDLKSFEAYINLFIEYMNARDDIYYFGIQRSDGLLGEMIPHEVAHKIDGDFEWESGYLRYTFAYSLTDELERNDYACSTHIQYKGDPVLVEFEYEKEDKVATVRITTNGAFASDCVDSELTGFGKHSITYEDNVGALYPDYQPTLSADSDDTVTVKISKSMNADIQVKVIYSAEVSKILSCSATHEDFCEYTFDMPAHDVTVVIEYNPDKIANTGTETGFKMLSYRWDGYGISQKEIDACDLGYAIIDRLSELQETGTVIPKISDDFVDENAGELPVAPGTMWIECGSVGVFRLNPEWTEICKVQTHLGEGKALRMTDTLRELLGDAWNYYPNDCWSGTYENGEVTLEQVYKEASAVDSVSIDNIYIENKIDSNNNKITLSILANESKTVKVSLMSYQSDDNLGTIESRDIDLTKNEETTMDFEFYGFYNASYDVNIIIDNTRITLTINPKSTN